ncbi:MAG: transporter substrate-binding domain-containing protein [Coriobacteriia bacterium]|nr:transporter substrate-binding domain-containing protein [Coriobacteriia bacterium]MCL2537411.1 transporter substrate-binding domain-containing protein [Coriobacteriia bacterium]
MNKHKLIAFTMVFLLVGGLASCTPTRHNSQRDFRTVSSYLDFVNSNARIGSEAGDVYAQVASEIFNAESTPEYATIDEALDAMLAGESDAVLASGGFVRQLLRSERSSSFSYLAIPADVFINESGPIFHDSELRDAYNSWYQQAVADGTWNEMVNRWLHGNQPRGEEIPSFDFPSTKGVLKVADTGSYPPLSYLDDQGHMIGFGIEAASRFALDQGMGLEVQQMLYDDIIPAVESGAIDMSACVFSTLATRDQDLIFGDPGVFMQAVLVIPRQPLH